MQTGYSLNSNLFQDHALRNSNCFQLPCSISQHLGTRLNVAWDDQHCACLMLRHNRSNAGHSEAKEPPCSAQSHRIRPALSFEGSSFALIVCPTRDFPYLLKKAAHEFGLLTNENAMGIPSNKPRWRAPHIGSLAHRAKRLARKPSITATKRY